MLTPSACVLVRAQEPCLRSSLGTEPECGPSQHHDWGCLGPSWVSPHGPAAQEFPQRGPGHIHPVCLCRCHRGSCSWSTAVPLIELAVFFPVLQSLSSPLVRPHLCLEEQTLLGEPKSSLTAPWAWVLGGL